MNNNLKLKSFKRFIISTVLLSFIFNLSIAQTENENLAFVKQMKSIEEFANRYIEQNSIPGMSIAVYKNDHVWSKGFGYLDIENKVKADSNTVYILASVTKPMIAVAIVKLAEDGKLDLDDNIQKYVKYFPKKKWDVSIRQLLGHLGGISNYKEGFKELDGLLNKHLSIREAIDIFKDWELIHEPGTKYFYSNYGYNLLGATIAEASGMPLEEYMSEMIWKPMGMNSTYLKNPDNIVLNRARGYKRKNGKLENAEFLDPSLCFASGGIESSAIDLIRFSKGLDESKVLSSESQNLMYNSMTTNDGMATRYGMGWTTEFYHGYWVVKHTGWQDGTSTLLWRFPWSEFAIAITANLEGVGLHSMAEYITAKFLNTHNVAPKTRSPEDNKISMELWTLFIYGLSFHDRFGSEMTDDSQKLMESFNLINQALDPKEIAKKLPYKSYMPDDDPMTIVGSYIADVLEKKFGTEKLSYYRAGHFFAFFNDYISLYKNDYKIKKSYHFSELSEKTISDWNECWEEIFTKEVTDMIELPLYEYEMNNVVVRIGELFKGKEIYPEFWKLNNYAYQMLNRGKAEEGLKALLVGIELYPWNINLYDSAGEFYNKLGDRKNAIKYYQKALELNPNLKTSKKALEELTSN